jgi:hypothetical protein
MHATKHVIPQHNTTQRNKYVHIQQTCTSMIVLCSGNDFNEEKNETTIVIWKGNNETED